MRGKCQADRLNGSRENRSQKYVQLIRFNKNIVGRLNKPRAVMDTNVHIMQCMYTFAACVSRLTGQTL